MPNAAALTMVARLLRRMVIGVVLVILAYVAAALVGGSIPVNAGWRPPAGGVTIWVEDNGIHTGLVLPKVAAGVDWRGFAPAGDLVDKRYGGYDHVAIGWGEHAFYLETPSWAEVRPGTVMWAALGSDRTLLHVEHVPAPADSIPVRRIVLRPAEYRRLAAFILATRAPGRRRWRGYGPNDVFYAGVGRYHALRTCNSWTGAALAAAGVRVGWWTPLPVTVMGWF